VEGALHTCRSCPSSPQDRLYGPNSPHLVSWVTPEDTQALRGLGRTCPSWTWGRGASSGCLHGGVDPCVLLPFGTSGPSISWPEETSVYTLLHDLSVYDPRSFVLRWLVFEVVLDHDVGGDDPS